MSLTEDRMTAQRDGELLSLGVAASTLICGGHMVALNASGYALQAADSAGQNVVAVSEEQIDNTDGGNGDLNVKAIRKKAFVFKQSATNPVGAANLFADVYVEDSETISSDGGTNSIVAGTLIAYDDSTATVEIG